MADRAAVEARAHLVTRMLQLHGGGVEVLESDTEGVVRLGFTGLCTACWMRPITLENLVKPAFRDLDGVREVHVDGVRLSRHAQEKLSAVCGDPRAGSSGPYGRTGRGVTGW